MDIPIRASFWRGGTSRAVLFREDDLAEFDQRAREAIILAAIGSPDPYGRQIDGLGGGISSLSKAAIIGKAAPGSGAEVTFQFAQVDVTSPSVEFLGTCGNISAAVGPFAIEQGLVNSVDPETSVIVRSVNTGQRFIAHVPTPNGRFEPDGDFAIDGVPGTASKIGLEYLEPGGSIGRGLLPTGSARERLRLTDGRELEISIVDAANPMVYLRASDLGITGTEQPAQLDADQALCSVLQEVRALAAVRIGLARNMDEAHKYCKAIPKVAVVNYSQTYYTTDGHKIAAEDIDLVVRMLSMGKTHRTIAMTTAICTAVAAQIEDTIVAEVTNPRVRDTCQTRIGHPAGVMPIGAKVQRLPSGEWYAYSATTYRTARKIMDGFVYVPLRYLRGEAWFQTQEYRLAATNTQQTDEL
jgi:2-methylaconitate cis-trans-isomerase PrpF